MGTANPEGLQVRRTRDGERKGLPTKDADVGIITRPYADHQ